MEGLTISLFFIGRAGLVGGGEVMEELTISSNFWPCLVVYV